MNQARYTGHFSAGLLLIGLIGGAVVNAATLVVDRNPGRARFQTIQSAMDQAQPGDTIKVGAGIYRERIRFKSGGKANAPLTLSGDPGAIIDGSSDVRLDWQPRPEFGPGVYRAALDFAPFTVTAEGKVLAFLDEKRVDPALPHPDRDKFRWPEVFRNGVGPSGWDGVRAIAMYRHRERDLLVRFKDELDPRRLAMTVAPREACILVDGADWCIVAGFELRNAAYGVIVQNAVGTIIEHNRIGPTDYGIHVGVGSARCVVRYNEISMRPWAGSDFRRAGQWDVWEACKHGGFYDRYAVRLAEGAGGHEVHDNLIQDHWDGIQSGYPGTAEQNANVRIHHNHLRDIFDDALETSGGQINCEWFENVIENARCACRVKDPLRGPLYIYRNLFFNNGQDFRNYSGSKGPAPAVVWVYHNTSTSDTAVTMNYAAGTKITTPNYHYLNNLFWCRNWVAKTNPAYPAPDWNGDYNVLVRLSPGAARPWDTGPGRSHEDVWAQAQEAARTAGMERHSTWVAEGDPGFTDDDRRILSLQASSVARQRGVDLSAHHLPGCPPNYFGGERPDAGALQFGEPMPSVPRKPPSLP